jgi:2,3-bisphosphoglycerate-dependent phosphoglycerate mutase
MTKIVLLRHGQSVCNEQNRFTGWTDVDLSQRGREEALIAAEGLKSQGYNLP